MTAHTPLDAAQLEERMDVYLDPALSSRRTAAGPARELSAYTRREQDFVLHWGTVIARDNAELAYQLKAFAGQAMQLMDLESVESWLLYAMDLYDKKGQMPAIRCFRDVTDFAANMQEKLAGTALDDVSGVLERFVCGLNGRPLTIAPSEHCFTDTESIFLPHIVGRLPDKEANFRLYKANPVHQWAQNWYGTWRADTMLEAITSGQVSVSDLDLLRALETVRLDACIARDFPGLRRDMLALVAALDTPDPSWHAVTARLVEPSTRVSDSLTLIPRLARRDVPTCCYRGELRPEAVRDRLELRASLERDRFRIALATLIEEQDGVAADDEQEEAEVLPETRARLAAERREDPDMPDGFSYQLFLDGKPLEPSDHMASVMESIIQDHGEIPPDYSSPCPMASRTTTTPITAANTASRTPAKPCSRPAWTASTPFASPSTKKARITCPICTAPQTTRWWPMCRACRLRSRRFTAS